MAINFKYLLTNIFFLAITWATLMSYGQNGYLDATKNVIDATRYIANELP